MSNDAVKEELLASNDEFRRLYDEHQDYHRRLEALNQKSLLSEDDEVEAKRMKVHKLHLKDRMESMIRAHDAPVSV